jgi:hypothetical protein
MSACTREVQEVCDPVRYSREEARGIAKDWARRSPLFYLEVVRFLQQLCANDQPDLDAVTRTLDVIISSTPACALLVVLRPILRECGARVRSKCVLVLAQHERNLSWAEKLMADDDGRIRASVVEGLWGHKSPEIEKLFSRAIGDKHHRVAANAAYGLYLLDATKSISLIERLVANQSPAFRSAAAWVIRKTGASELRGLLRPLLVDSDPAVRTAGFKALMTLAPR